MDAQDENGLKKCFTAGVGVDVFEHKVLKIGRGLKGREEGGPGSGLDWCLVELSGDAGML